MPRPKKDPILIALGDAPEKWNDFLLKTYGLPEDPQPRDEVSESAFQDEDGERLPLEDVAGLQIRLGEEPPKGLAKIWAEVSFLEPEPTERWKRSLAFFRAIVRIWAAERRLSKQKRAELLREVDAFRPTEPLPVFPDSLGTPEEFFERWQRGEIEVRFTSRNRATQTCEIWQHAIPPDEEENLDPADEPPGYWAGLKWIPEVEGS